MPLTLVRNDITAMDVDAIVNAANSELLSGGGVCGAIFKAAGHLELREACLKLAPVEVGNAVITPGFKLKARSIIHAVGPIYQDGKHHEKALLENAYRNSFDLAVKHGLTSIAFPLISSGIYGYPKEEALSVAMSTLRNCLKYHDLEVFLVVYDTKAFELSQKLLGSVQSFIEAHLVIEDEAERHLNYNRRLVETSMDRYEGPMSKTLEDWILLQDDSFSNTLLNLIDQKGKLDSEVYKKANIDRKLFSKIRSNPDYRPAKRTVIALAIGLELDLEETKALLDKAGYTLSRSHKTDLIIEYFILNKQYDIDEINQVLFKYDQPCLGL